ncbi:hypothetical protein ACFVWT_16920 [Arthrobacter sp. NPDC058288]|uniref:hypothetical protein n=1 Tax=Arthrobacter sp. NPDC058288 TaxID=3346424 RepID=UPI0036F0D4A6
MTTRHDVSGGTVDRLLLDAGHTDVPELRAALLSIASLGQMQVPAPGPELAAMLAGPRDELTKKRWLRRHRPTVVGLSVLAGMGLGVSGVAATGQVSATGSGLWSIQELTTDWTPDWRLPLEPAVTGRGGPAAWASPLFLQLDQVDPAGAGQPAEPEKHTAVAGHATDQAPETVPGSRAHTAANAPDMAPGAASDNSHAGKPGMEDSGGSDADAAGEERSTQGSPENVGVPSEGPKPAPEANSSEPRGNNPKKDKSGTGLLGSAVESAVDPVSSWLKKFRQ